MKNSRREFLKKSAAFAAVSTAGVGMASCTPQEERPVSNVEWPVIEGPDTPKMCIWVSNNLDEPGMRKVKQLGVDHVAMGGPRTPWSVETIREIQNRFAENDLSVLVMMIGGFNDVIHGREGAEEQIGNVQESLRAAGEAGVPVVEYNWYARRLMEGYYRVDGRGGAGYTGFDFDRARDLPVIPEIGTHSSEELWDRLANFLEAVIPVAEEAGVRMALHPNDPPVPETRGNHQIMRTFDDWKRLIGLYDSPSNGMTFDPGVSREIGEDPVEVCRWLGSRDRINHAHYRNVVVEEPYLKYMEVFPDNGQVNMFAVMQELFRQNYRFGLWPEHARALDYDQGRQVQGITGAYADVGGGGYAGLSYDIGFARAMMQVVQSLRG